MSVRVTFVEASRDRVLAEVELAPDQLPETFAVSTTLHLGGKDWHVERAEPVTRGEYVASGALRLTLREVQMVDPRTILFSLPTLENTQPPLVGGELGDAFRMHEDDWRQHELVSSALSAEIDAELADIVEAKASRKGVGFEHLHVRQRIPEPLTGVVLTRAEVAAALGHPPSRSLAIGDLRVEGGFALTTDHAIVYGLERDGALLALGLTADVEAISALAEARSLIVVDWCAAHRGGLG